jgi:hypothetical protein
MIEMTGYDATNRRGFKKVFFETTKDGKRTRNAEVSDGLHQDDWVEVTMDDTSYKNVQSIKVIAEPAGQDAPAQGGGGGGGGQRSSGGGGGGGSDKMSKAEWAAKQAKEAQNIARSVALKAAVEFANTSTAPSAKAVSAMEKLSYRMEAFLVKGSFDAEVDAVPEPERVVDDHPSTQQATQPAGQGDGTPINEDSQGAPPIDDDIPF